MTNHFRSTGPAPRQDENEKGQAVILLVLTLVVLLGMAALTIDLGEAYYTTRTRAAATPARTA